MRYLTLYENFNKITFEITESDYDTIFSKCCEGIELNTDIPIFRSVNGELGKELYLIDPRKYIRESANTSNYYTLIMDNEPEWVNFPKRKHGIICSLNESYMDNEFRVVPLLKWNNILIKYGIEYFESPKWGICSGKDIWDSFDILKSLFDNFIQAVDFNYILEKFGKVSDYETLKSNFSKISIDEINKLSSYIKLTNDIQKMIEYMKNNNIDNLYDLVRKIYSPEGFKVMTYQDIQKNYTINDRNEIWTDSPVFYLNVMDRI